MKDAIGKLIEEIRQCQELQRARLRNNFLNTVGEIFERDGFGTTRIFLLDKKEKTELRDQAKALLKVLELMEAHPEIRQRRAIGRTIFKTLIAIGGYGKGTSRR